MLILTTIKDVLNVIMKYVSLAAISRIPGFYFSSLTGEHKLTKVSSLKLKITKWRTRDKTTKDAEEPIQILRFINKTFRIFYISWAYYFMPFTAVFINFRFMISECKCWGDPETWSPDDEICPRDIHTDC